VSFVYFVLQLISLIAQLTLIVKLLPMNFAAFRFPSALSFILLLSLQLPLFGAWQPAKGPLATRWAKEVSPDKVHPEYPRPQMVRTNWLNLNGLWDYAIRARETAPGDQSSAVKNPLPSNFDGQILVPFPVESALSGVMRQSEKQPALVSAHLHRSGCLD